MNSWGTSVQVSHLTPQLLVNVMSRWNLIVLQWGFLLCGFVLTVQAQTVEPPETPEAVEKADRLIASIFSSTTGIQYPQGAEVYLSLLAQLDRALEPSEAEILLKHLRHLALILPDEEQDVLGLSHVLEEEDVGQFVEGAGARLVEWWRLQDAFPATENNERLEEHLRRVALATERYAWDEDPRGFDDRGEIYVRLGLPSRSTVVANRSTELRMKAAHGRIPQNEFWVYEHVSHDAYYLFIQRSAHNPYQLSEVSELLRHRSLEYMEEVLGQLALKHTAFGAAYDAVTQYLTMPPPDALPSGRFASKVVADVRMQDSQHEYAQATEVPVVHSSTQGFRETLDVPLRWARFLEPDGTTRTEMYWTLEPSALQPSRRLVRRLKRQGQEPSEKYLLSFAIAQQNADFQHRAVQRKHYLVPVKRRTNLPVTASTVSGDTGTYHLGLQWDQQWVTSEDGQLEPGVQLKVGVQRLDTLQALHGAGQQLEMSDLKPLIYNADQDLEAASPYPYAHLRADAQLALYFEVYHLAYNADGETQYRLSYEVNRAGRRSLLGRRTPKLTATEAQYTGTDRTAQEYIAVDLADWNGDGTLTVTVRATDEVTGAEMSRSIQFTGVE